MEASFTASVRTGAGVHPASYTIVTESFSGLKLLGCGFEHPPPSKAEVKERVVVYLYSSLCAFMAYSRTITFCLQPRTFCYRIQRAGVSV